MRKTQWIVIGVVLVAAIGGVLWFTVGKSDTTPQASNATSDTANQSSSTAPTALATDKVSIKDFAFSPSNITVKKGTTVTWTNNDSMAHTVIETDSKNGPKSGTLNNGDTYTFTYDTVGTFSYVCSFHSSMTGSVTVTE